MSGSAGVSSASAAASAAPVGVVRSPGPLGRSARPRNSSSVAGAGSGMSPCALRAVPPPEGSGKEKRRETPSASRSSEVPSTSTMASSAPTSWNSTCSGATPWMRPSAPASAAKVESAIARARSGSWARPSRSRRSRQGRCGGARAATSGGSQTSTCSAEIPFTSVCDSRDPHRLQDRPRADPPLRPARANPRPARPGAPRRAPRDRRGGAAPRGTCRRRCRRWDRARAASPAELCGVPTNSPAAVSTAHAAARLLHLRRPAPQGSRALCLAINAAV